MKTLSHRPRGFTLIELLIVVAIIAILAAIAVPNFLEAQVRAKVARAKSDVRSLVTATETYRVDNSGYPLPSDIEGDYIPDPIAATVDWFETKTAISLTTPIAYMTSRVGDIFATRGTPESRNFHYASMAYLNIRNTHNPTQNWKKVFQQYYMDLKGTRPPSTIEYFYLSFGPDKDHDMDVEHSGPVGEPHEHGKGAIYDSTNGTVSSGDIHYMGPGIGFL